MARELNYYALYLEHQLREDDDPRAKDRDYIDGKADQAADEYQNMRMTGMTVNQAQECAMRVLLSDLIEEELKRAETD